MSVSNSSAVTTHSGNPGHGATTAAETLKTQQPPVYSGYQGTPPHSNVMTCHAPEKSTASHPPTHHMVSTVPRPGHPQNGDPDSIANSMAGSMGPAQAQGGGMNMQG